MCVIVDKELLFEVSRFQYYVVAGVGRDGRPARKTLRDFVEKLEKFKIFADLAPTRLGGRSADLLLDTALISLSLSPRASGTAAPFFLFE